MRNMTWKAWLMTSLWFSTLIVLFAFVFTAALMEKGGKENGAKVDSYSIKVKTTDFTKTTGKGKLEDVEFANIDTEATGKVSGITTAQQLYVGKISKASSSTKKAVRTLSYKVAVTTKKDADEALKVFKISKFKTFTLSQSSTASIEKVMEQVADSDAKAYQNGLAATAGLFTILIFGALGTTVGIKFYERKHSKGGAK